MPQITVLAAAISLAASALAQTTVSFECYATGPLPLDPITSCEGAASNGLGGSTSQTGIADAPNCGFPTAGARYLRLDANGPIGVGGGGPFPWPTSFTTPPAEVRIPIPPGSTTLSFDWDFFNSEGAGSATFNDGMAIGIVTASGALVQQLAYADNQMPFGGCTDVVSGFGAAILPAGFKTFSGPLPALSGCEYLSIVCWNGGDNSVSSVALVDDLVFGGTGPPCPVPCFPGPPALSFDSPGGPGCLRARIAGMPPSGTWFLAVTLVGGAFPSGWFHGVDIPLPELVGEITFGFPFSGPLGACGSAVLGPFCAGLTGLSVFAVALGIDGPTLGPWTAVSAPMSYVVP